MARKKKGANLGALEAAAKAAAVKLARAEAAPPARRRSPRRRDPLGLTSWSELAKPRTAAGAGPVLRERNPRELSLTDPLRKETLLALELAAGKPIGRRTREKLKNRIPEIVHAQLCARKRQRRSVMFARGAAGSGKRSAARRQRKHMMGKC